MKHKFCFCFFCAGVYLDIKIWTSSAEPIYSKFQLEVIWATDFESKEAARWWSAKEGETAGGRGDAERAEWMGEGLFVHASNSLGVISIACSIIVPFEEGQKKKKKYCITSKASSQSHGPVGRISRSVICNAAICDLQTTFAVVDCNQSTSPILPPTPHSSCFLLENCNFHSFMRQQPLCAAEWVSALLRSIKCSIINLPLLHMSLPGPLCLPLGIFFSSLRVMWLAICCCTVGATADFIKPPLARFWTSLWWHEDAFLCGQN